LKLSKISKRGDIRWLSKKVKFANVLKKLGVKKGDRVTIYLPMIPELPIAMLADPTVVRQLKDKYKEKEG